MIDIHKQVVYWRKSAEENWQVANELVKAGRLRHGLFFAHLALEKILKAHICLKTDELAPRIHNLVRLAEITSLELTSSQIDILAEINTFNVEGRYPDITFTLPTLEEASRGDLYMVCESIALIVRKYLMNLQENDIPVSYGVVFGSQARGEAGQWSDIDLLIVSSRFDEKCNRADINLLWRIAAHTDSRIEPIPVGRKQFMTDDTSAIIEIARREGQIIPLAE